MYGVVRNKMKKREKKKKIKPIPTRQLQTADVDYAVYHMTAREKILCIIPAVIVLFGIGYTFYKNVIISALFALLAFKYPDIREKEIAKERQRTIGLQFKDMLYSMSSAVSSGISVESSLRVALEDMNKQYADAGSIIIKELELMVSRISFGMTIEEVFDDFAKRSHNEDVQTFANIFVVAKRQGGNMIQIIHHTTEIISEKIETKEEIQTALSGRAAEQKVMTAMPILIVLFMTYTTGGFMDQVFTDIRGRAAATAALACILIGYFWSKKITDIEI